MRQFSKNENKKVRSFPLTFLLGKAGRLAGRQEEEHLAFGDGKLWSKKVLFQMIGPRQNVEWSIL